MNSFTKTKIGQNGGMERHVVDLTELPTHYHSISDNAIGWGCCDGYNGGGLHINSRKSHIGYTGGFQSHKNMPPIFVLNYIIKQPQNGGASYKIDYPYPPRHAL